MKAVVFSFFLVLQTLFGFSQFGKSIGLIEADYRGGKGEFKKLLLHEMVYPKEELANQVSAKIGYEVLVHPDFSFEIARPLFTASAAFNKEAIRLIKMTKFSPAAQDGFPLESSKQVIIKFNPKKYAKMVEERGYEIPKNFPLADSTLIVYELTNVERAPQPIIPTGYNSLNDFIYSNLVYPPHALKMNMTGKTILDFIVEASGEISNVYPTHYLGGGCYEEARRVLGKIKWEPAIINGKPVRCKISHTVYFNLPNQSPKGRDPIAE